MKYGKRAVDNADTEIMQKPTKVAKGVLKCTKPQNIFSLK